MNISNDILSIRIFGSFGRGDFDSMSDLDVLIVSEEAIDSDIIKNKFNRQLINIYKKEPSYSWYSKSRIISMFNSGHLFAWHLYIESKLFNGNSNDFITSLGTPQPYLDAIIDAGSIYNILKSIKPAILESPFNTIYESGILFVCLRNLGLIFSKVFLNSFNFSLDSPFHILNNSLNIDYSDYLILKQNRRASMRGAQSTAIDKNKLLNLIELSSDWASNKISLIKE